MGDQLKGSRAGVWGLGISVQTMKRSRAYSCFFNISEDLNMSDEIKRPQALHNSQTTSQQLYSHCTWADTRFLFQAERAGESRA